MKEAEAMEPQLARNIAKWLASYRWVVGRGGTQLTSWVAWPAREEL